MRNIFFIVSLVVFFSCSFSKEKKNDKSFFDFDKVVHFSKDINETEILNIYQLAEQNGKGSNEDIYANLVSEFYPLNIEREFEKDLYDFNFNSKKVDSKKHFELNHIFSERKCDSSFVFACVPIYRDILLFYKNDSLIGIAKICFQCRQSHILGAKNNTGDFGQCGGYEKLYKLLKSK